MRLPDLQEKWHGAPVWVWVGGGTVVTVAGLILLKRWRAARAGGSAAPAVGGTSGLGSGGLGGGGWSGAGSGSFSDGSTVPAEWSNEFATMPSDLFTWARPVLPSVAPAAPVVDAGTPASMYEAQQVATYAAPVAGSQNTAITIPLDQLNRPPTAEELAAGEAVTGVATSPIPAFSFSPAVAALPVYQQPATINLFGPDPTPNPLIPNEFKSTAGTYDPGAAFRYFYG